MSCKSWDAFEALERADRLADAKTETSFEQYYNEKPVFEKKVSEFSSPKYHAVAAKSISELIGKVQRLMEDGWICQGGIAIEISGTWGRGETFYFQAMTKNSAEDTQGKNRVA